VPNLPAVSVLGQQLADVYICQDVRSVAAYEADLLGPRYLIVVLRMDAYCRHQDLHNTDGRYKRNDNIRWWPGCETLVLQFSTACPWGRDPFQSAVYLAFWGETRL